MTPARVLLINPRATYAHEIAQKCYPPLNLLYLARALLDAGHAAGVLDANALRLDDFHIARAARRFEPKLIGLPLYSEILPSVHELALTLRRTLPAARFVLGGAHAAALPRQTLNDFHDCGVEFVLLGQAEESLVQLVNAMRDPAALAAVPNLVWRAADGIRENPIRTPGRELDDIAPPARDLVQDLYRRKLYYTLLVGQRPVDTLITSRGCPFSCRFCYNRDHHYRAHSVERVMDEILSIARRGIRDIEICDDTFTCDRARAMAVFAAIIRERLPLSFRVKSRVDAVDPEFLRAARRAGVYLIAYGMESGDDEMLRRMNKRATAADNARACRLTQEAGIACHSSWLIGYPGETPESIARTVDFIIAIKPTTAQIAMLRPYPRTEAYEEAKEKGWLRGEWTANGGEYPWVQLPWTRDRAHLESIVQQAVRRIYYRPRYAAQFARMAVAGANVTLVRYALQEARKNLRNLVKPGAARSGGI